jgi:redox-sensitive bicupin YhaK (pirin superfamily)
MASYILHKADSRGHADHGWLSSHHTFSFANYYNPERMQFGALRVFNDDKVAGGRGFDAHPHDNMEIISIPLEGDLEHKDNLGNTEIIRQGDVQVMSTGTGVFHSEYNANKDRSVSFLQIWLFPNQLNVTPRYDQITLTNKKNELQQIISPNADDAGTWVYQDAWFNMGQFDKGYNISYPVKKQGNGVYVFVLSGSFTIDGQQVNTRDAIGITDAANIRITAEDENASLLIIDVPML